jgi:hypothetical protein
MRLIAVAGVAFLLSAARVAASQAPPSPSPDDRLLTALMIRDEAGVERMLEQGAPVDARNKENNRTALYFAAEMGDVAIVELLLRHGASVDIKDTLHGERPIGAASRRGHVDVVRLLLGKDTTDGAERVAWNGVFQRNVEVLDAALGTGQLSAEALSFLLDEAERGGASDVADRLRRAGALAPKPIALPEASLARCAASYRTEDGAKSLKVGLVKDALQVTYGDATFPIVPLDTTFFVREGHRFPTLRFEIRNEAAAAVTVRDGDEWTRYLRLPK